MGAPGRGRGLRRTIVAIGRRMYARGLVTGTEGNVSARAERGTFLMTPSGRCKGDLREADLVAVDAAGRRVAGRLAPSSELPMHLAVYRARPDVGAIVHAHPPVATGFAIAGLPLDERALAEMVVLLGRVPLAEYGTPTSRELSTIIARHIPRHDALLMANHGALTVGRDLWEAYFRMEILEHAAQATLVARLLGRAKPLPPRAIRKLRALTGAGARGRGR